MEILVYLLYINTVFAVIYFVFFTAMRRYKKAFSEAAFILCAPYVGLTCIVFSTLSSPLLYKNAEDIRIDELSFSRERVKNLVDIDIERESDKIPLTEAMLVANRKNRRKVLLDILKGQKDLGTMSLIKEATTDLDSEISHYAISYITSMTAKYREQEESALKQLRDNSSTKSRIIYINCLIEILKPEFFTLHEQERYIQNLDAQIKTLMKTDAKAVTGQMLLSLVNFWEGIGEEHRANEYIQFARDKSMTDLQAAKLCLKYYYRKQDKEGFSRLLSEIRTSTLELDEEVLEWIRFYSIL